MKIFFIIAVVSLFTTQSFSFPQRPIYSFNNDEYSTKVQPIFDKRCVACHSCFNSPCQLDLSSYEGVSRGANKISVYDFPKLEARKPTRLYVDATTPSEWRKMDFYSVDHPAPKQTILSYLLNDVVGIETDKQKEYKSEESRICMNEVSEKEKALFLFNNRAGRMPYGLPQISPEDLATINQWMKEGSQGPNTKKLEDEVVTHPHFSKSIKTWEDFFNRRHMQARLSSRYIYEHLFLAHLYFPEKKNQFFRLVRSKTKTGSILEVATSFPFDDPGKEFYYRLRPITQTITHKNHIPFELTAQKRQKWEEDFYTSKWEEVPREMPDYGKLGANPFLTFAAIPAKARYEFFLSEASYHIMTFIKGPVCRGQTALNVINDHFWVLFLDPSKDPLVNSPELYAQIQPLMNTPAEIGDDFSPSVDFRNSYWSALQKKYEWLKNNKKTLNTSWLWNGEKRNTNSTITVYRHFDSATVLRGLQGVIPKTVWVLDYQVFETIYYNLSAGYNVFGPLLHQLDSRLYMEISRIAAEDLFITFLAPQFRDGQRNQWNVPVPRQKKSVPLKLVEAFSEDTRKKMEFKYPYLGNKVISEVNFDKIKFLQNLMAEHFSSSQTTVQATTEFTSLKKLKDMSQKKAKAVQYLPDTLLVKIEGDETPYTLIHNKEHFNVSMMMFEDERRNPLADTLDVLPGIATSYANAFIVLNPAQVDSFVQEYLKLDSEKKTKLFLKKYVTSRKSSNFWSTYEWFSERSYDARSEEWGWLDLNRYENL